jgi:hypothetical protein
MIAWFKRLFHHHEWEIMSNGPYMGIGSSGQRVAVGNWYDCKCKVCGKIKRTVT